MSVSWAEEVRNVGGLARLVMLLLFFYFLWHVLVGGCLRTSSGFVLKLQRCLEATSVVSCSWGACLRTCCGLQGCLEATSVVSCSWEAWLRSCCCLLLKLRGFSRSYFSGFFICFLQELYKSACHFFLQRLRELRWGVADGVSTRCTCCRVTLCQTGH